jgi:hypothetical protein
MRTEGVVIRGNGAERVVDVQSEKETDWHWLGRAEGSMHLGQ